MMKFIKNILSASLLICILLTSLSLSAIAEESAIPEKTTWSVAVSSEFDASKNRMIDGSVATYWHSKYEVVNNTPVNPDKPPFYAYITLPYATEFSGVSIVPRAATGAHTNKLNVYVSDTAADDNTDASWALVAGNVEFATPAKGDQTPLSIDFGMNIRAKKIMLEILETSDGYGTIAEVDLTEPNNRYTISGPADLLEYNLFKNNDVLSDKTQWTISVNSGESSIAKAIDGIVSANNYWHSYFKANGANITYHDIPPYYIYITFPKKTVISNVEVIPRQDSKNGCPLEMSFYAAGNDSDEMILLEEDLAYQIGSSGRIIDLATNIVAKKILIKITGSNGGYGCISEINVTGNDPEKKFSELETYIDTADYSREYEVSKNYFTIECDYSNIWANNNLNNLIDSSESTFWQTDNVATNVKPTVIVDMNDEFTLNKIDYYPRQTADFHGQWRKVTLQVSMDGVDYETIGTFEFPENLERRSMNFTKPTKCRYVRFLEITGNKSKVGGAELYFYQSWDGLQEYNEIHGGTFLLEYGSDEVICEKGANPGNYTLDGPVIVKDGWTFVPITSFANQLIYKGSATEDTSNDLRKVTVYLNDGIKTFTLQDNNHLVYSLDNNYGDVRYTMYTLPFVKDGVFYAPLHFLCELIGYDATYDSENLTLVKEEFNMYDTVEWIDPAKSFSTYTVSYDLGQEGNGKTEDGRTFDSVKIGESLALPTVEAKLGYKFDGWFYPGRVKKLAGNGNDAYMPKGDVTLYAAYTEIENLDEIKAEVIALINDVNLNLYRTAERKAIEEIISTAQTDILSAETKDAVGIIYNDAKAAIDAVETDEEMTRAEDENGLSLTISSTGGGYVTKNDEPATGTIIVAAGATVTLKAYPENENGIFKAWIDGTTKKVLSREPEYVFDMYSKRHVIALFTDKYDEEVFASFLTRNDQYAKYTYTEKGTDTTTIAPDAKQMYVSGYTFTGWSPELGVINKNTDYRGVYEKEPNVYKVTVTGGSEIDNGDEFTAEYNDTYVVKANEPANGLVFAGWKLNGVLVSYDEYYSFGVFGDIELEATYAKAVVKTPLVVMLDVQKSMYNEYNIASFLGDYYLPDGMTLVESGALYAKTDVDKGTLVMSNLGSSVDGKVIKRTIAKPDMMFKLSASYGDLGITARGYLIYLDADGVKHTIYTDTVYIVEETIEAPGDGIEEDIDFS